MYVKHLTQSLINVVLLLLPAAKLYHVLSEGPVISALQVFTLNIYLDLDFILERGRQGRERETSIGDPPHTP